jgi:hypothetical protein
MDPMMPELERLFEHEQSELKRIGMTQDQAHQVRELIMPALADWKITWPDREKAPKVVPPTGPKYAHSLALMVSVEPALVTDRTYICMKNKLQPFTGTGTPNHRRVLMAELNDVRVYIEGGRIIVTNKDVKL